jgi:hypothetical protein
MNRGTTLLLIVATVVALSVSLGARADRRGRAIARKTRIAYRTRLERPPAQINPQNPTLNNYQNHGLRRSFRRWRRGLMRISELRLPRLRIPVIVISQSGRS